MTFPTERWTICERDHIHWGAAGAAGLLFCYAPEGAQPMYLLAQRSRSVDEGGTWGVPGGAIRADESPEMAARRETVEEIGTLPSYRVTGIESQDCGGGWIFHTITADVEDRFDAFCGQETDATGWFTREEIRSLPLHPGIQRWLDR